MKPDGIKENGTRAVPFFLFFTEEEGGFCRQILADGASGIHVVFKVV